MPNVTKKVCNSNEDADLRRGPWTLEEDSMLIHYIACHGEGRWNLLAKCAGKEPFHNTQDSFLFSLIKIIHPSFFFFFVCSSSTSSGLKRTGKSCRLRWLNYLKPDIKRGNLTPQEQLLILELHSKWGNR